MVTEQPDADNANEPQNEDDPNDEIEDDQQQDDDADYQDDQNDDEAQSGAEEEDESSDQRDPHGHCQEAFQHRSGAEVWQSTCRQEERG